MTDRNKCYNCKHVGRVPGSAHRCCWHPAYKDLMKHPAAEVMGILVGIGRLPPVQVRSTSIEVEGHPTGIKRGWFNHPFDFDPTWLVKCTGFEEESK